MRTVSGVSAMRQGTDGKVLRRPRAGRASTRFGPPATTAARYCAQEASMAGFRLEVPRAALVITDPQVDFLSPRGLAWRLVGESVERNHTVDLAKRLRGAGVSQVVLAGMSANL